MSEADFLNAIIYMGRIKIVHIHFEAIMFLDFSGILCQLRQSLRNGKISTQLLSFWQIDVEGWHMGC